MLERQFESGTVDTGGGRRFHTESAGPPDGPLVLLCHGFPESWYSWRHQLPALAGAGYRAVAMDMRGYGRSYAPADVSSYRIDRLVGDCVAVVDALSPGGPGGPGGPGVTGGPGDRALIVGHDWGAPVAWTAAWLHPDRFRGVVGLSVPFGARGLLALPGDPFGARRPSAVQREVAGEGRLFYQEHFHHPDRRAEREAEAGLRDWLAAALYSFSASPPLPEALAGVDLSTLETKAAIDVLRATMCVPEGARLRDLMSLPEGPLSWLTDEDLDFYAAEFARTGLTGGFNYYRCVDESWEHLADQAGRPLTVPALHIGGDRDLVTMWSREAAERAPEVATDHRGTVVLRDCGHWIQQERPSETNDVLLDFFSDL
ncbi:alpha/beta fold hydrolase [Streptomyces sp. NPDC048172]|uniref:alpha/beta fold hydrolase n=1 Tax=Streptomyces sp. NPDC048172 TaxID=3365505 RepID=UPI003718601A